MNRWSRKKTKVPLFIVVFAVLLVASILYNENCRDIQVQKEAIALQSRFPTSAPNDSYVRHRKKRDLGKLDWSTACISTRNYTLHGSRIRLPSEPTEEKIQQDCNWFSGDWIFDNTSHPLYNESDCPYMSDQLACTKHGRPDSMYQNWRWQPQGCNLQRWNASEMLEKLRGKRLMYVGDSLDRGQWISMVCLLQSVIPAGKKSMSPNAALTIFRAEEYNATVEFYWAPLLVKSNSDDPINHRLDKRIIAPELIDDHGSEWAKADILIFNTYLWWRQGNIKVVWSADEDGICEELDGVTAMNFALQAWADWVASSVNQYEKKVFFVTMSPTHLWRREWEPGTEGNCYNEKSPVDMKSYWGSGSDVPTMQMADAVLHRLGSKVSVVNITQLSEYRKDGHPSIYRKFWETFSQEQLANPASYSDCIHWCLPGVPDVWNELIFNLL